MYSIFRYELPYVVSENNYFWCGQLELLWKAVMDSIIIIQGNTEKYIYAMETLQQKFTHNIPDQWIR